MIMKAEKFVERFNREPVRIGGETLHATSRLERLGLKQVIRRSGKLKKDDHNRLFSRVVSDFRDNPLLYLLSEYDCANLEIGPIVFKNEILVEESIGNKLVYFADFDHYDHLVVNLQNQSIEAIAKDTGKRDYAVSSDGNHFLDALLLLNQFLNERILDYSKFEDVDLNLDIAREISSLAGSIQYIDFYKSILI